LAVNSHSARTDTVQDHAGVEDDAMASPGSMVDGGAGGVNLASALSSELTDSGF
jgi:hypothetical protein